MIQCRKIEDRKRGEIFHFTHVHSNYATACQFKDLNKYLWNINFCFWVLRQGWSWILVVIKPGRVGVYRCIFFELPPKRKFFFQQIQFGFRWNQYLSLIAITQKKQQLLACVVSLDIRNKFHLARFISLSICISIQMVPKDCPWGPTNAANLSVLNSLKGDTALEQEEILQEISLIARI